MNVIYQKYISRDDARNNPSIIYIFGDNDARSGYGGQARELRGEKNGFGVRVKKLPSLEENAFYTDNEYESNCQKISEDIKNIKDRCSEETTIIFPKAGIGTGRAWLRFKAPRTYQYLCNKLYEQLGIKNGASIHNL
jgi:hypothetical protein